MILVDYPDRDLMFADLASKMAGEIKAALKQNELVSVAVPGGTTPGPVFDKLSEVDLDWSRVRILLSDERRVPADHERSNERLLRERLLVNRAADATFVRLVPEGEDMAPVEQALAPLLPLDVLLLGMGGDMHTASLFPGSAHLTAALDPQAPPVMMVDASEGLEPRITLTAPALSGASAIHVVITGDEKRAALDKAQKLPPQDAPIALVLRKAVIHWAP